MFTTLSRPVVFITVALAGFSTAYLSYREASPIDKLVHQFHDLKSVLDEGIALVAELHQDPLSVFADLPKIVGSVGEASIILGDMLRKLPRDDDELDGDHQKDLCDALQPVLNAQASLLDSLTILVQTLPVVGSLVNGAVETVQALLLSTTTNLLDYLPLCNDPSADAVANIFAAELKTYKDYREAVHKLELDQADTHGVEVLEIEEEAGITTALSSKPEGTVTVTTQLPPKVEKSTVTVTAVETTKESHRTVTVTAWTTPTSTESTVTVTTWTTVTTSS